MNGHSASFGNGAGIFFIANTKDVPFEVDNGFVSSEERCSEYDLKPVDVCNVKVPRVY